MIQKLAILLVILTPMMINSMSYGKAWGVQNYMEEDEHRAQPVHVPAPVIAPPNDVPLYLVFGTLSFLATVELIKSWF